MTDTASDFSLDTASLLASQETGEGSIEGRSPWALAWRRLRRNYVALFFLGVFFVILIACLLAPVYADHVAGTTANGQPPERHGDLQRQDDDVVSAGARRLQDRHARRSAACRSARSGSACGGKYVLGADQLGRDVAVRLLYGGLTSLEIGFASAFLCCFFGIVLALLAGLLRRLGRTASSRASSRSSGPSR